MGACFAAWSFAMAAMVDVVKVFSKRIEKNILNNELAIEFNMNYAESEIMC